MEAEMALLRRQLALASSAGHGGEHKSGIGGGGGDGPMPLSRATSTLSNGVVVELTAAEMERLQQIFLLFDEDNSGTIGAGEIQALHKRLGEAITDAEAQVALRAMNAVDGQVDFLNFVKWWDNMHVTGMFGDRRKGQRYAARFKFLKAKLSNPETAKFYTRASGSAELGDYRVNFFTKRGGEEVRVSPWHDVPLRTRDGFYNFIVEIPKWCVGVWACAHGGCRGGCFVLECELFRLVGLRGWFGWLVMLRVCVGCLLCHAHASCGGVALLGGGGGYT